MVGCWSFIARLIIKIKMISYLIKIQCRITCDWVLSGTSFLPGLQNQAGGFGQGLTPTVVLR
jgi:hypothetical protein